MKELRTEDLSKRKLEKYLNRLVRHIQNIEDPDEKQASIAFCIANLVLQNCDEIEGLGLLEKVKNLLGEIGKSIKPLSHFSRLSYIS